eukprot:TRINITY_DN29356_c0_g1_i1.p1 TRINITY_DN29356_c0_g1~~TRINITY_DN29356_c0_g1_i1.p1  ORF type:complete len:378 (+),score=70.35 TRINITY_DN29356_c0_g1_i1:204-1337(+)
MDVFRAGTNLAAHATATGCLPSTSRINSSCILFKDFSELRFRSSETGSRRQQACHQSKHRLSTRAVAVAAPPVEPSVSLEERKLGEEDVDNSRPFKITEVDSTAQLEYNPAPVLSVKDVSSSVRCITVEAEVSRELVPLDKAYTAPGALADVRLPDGEVVRVPVCSAPIQAEANDVVLLKMRGDIPAGSTKLAQYGVSVKAPMDLHVSKSMAPALYNLLPGAEIEVGAVTSGMDLRPIMYLARFATILIFASGDGIAAARAVIEAGNVGSLYLKMREEARLFYSASSPSQLAYREMFDSWQTERNVKVRTTVASASGEPWDGAVGSLVQLFDDDDLEYNPATTGAVVCGSKEENEEVVKMLTGEAGLAEKAVIRWDI